MGQFSWIYSDTNEQVRDNWRADTYLLVPEEFQDKYGEYIYEECYDGYGRFGRYDVYDLIAEWNKEMIPEIIRRSKKGNWHCSFYEDDYINMENYYNGKPLTDEYELRYIGIKMACYDEDNETLEYPIKITSKPMKYKDVNPSKSDPNQGWYYGDDEEEEWW